MSQIAFQFLQSIAADLSRRPLAIPTFVDASLGVRMSLIRKEMSPAELARVVSGEPLLSARVVALANSAAFTTGGKAITEVRNAVIRIGQNAVRNLSTALAMEQVSRAKELAPFRAQAREIWSHSLEVAVATKVLAHRVAKVSPDEALFAGLVHDLGHLYLMWRAGSCADLTRQPELLRDLVREWHPGIGAGLLQTLGVSEVITRAVDEHELDPATLPPGSLSQLLSVANRCARKRAEDEAAIPTPPPAAHSHPTAADALDEARGRAILAESAHAVQTLLAALKG